MKNLVRTRKLIVNNTDDLGPLVEWALADENDRPLGDWVPGRPTPDAMSDLDPDQKIITRRYIRFYSYEPDFPSTKRKKTCS